MHQAGRELVGVELRELAQLVEVPGRRPRRAWRGASWLQPDGIP
jgi:hypothetical protein